MDRDRSGVLPVTDLVRGMDALKNPAKALDVAQAHHQTSSLQKSLHDKLHHTDCLHRSIHDKLDRHIAGHCRHISSIYERVNEIAEKLGIESNVKHINLWFAQIGAWRLWFTARMLQTLCLGGGAKVLYVIKINDPEASASRSSLLPRTCPFVALLGTPMARPHLDPWSCFEVAISTWRVGLGQVLEHQTC